MSPELQTRLLRVLAESEFYRVGGQTAIRVDVRVIAATNQDLARAVKESRFREDLYHRLNVIRINTPPLRQRQEDIPLLLQHYLAEAAVELGSSAKSLDAGAMEALLTFSWPGNVRQRVNVARRLTVTAPGNVISAQDIPTDLGGTDRERHTGIREDTHRNHLGTHQRTPPGSGKAAGLGAQYVGAQDENLAPRLKQSD
jgi:two-component system nitrogen regulation response regulator GlnG